MVTKKRHRVKRINALISVQSELLNYKKFQDTIMEFFDMRIDFSIHWCIFK